MQVKGSTKVSNVIDFAKKALEKGEYRDVVWTSSGGGVVKAISCAEILKRSYPVHQITRLCYRKVDEYWQPQTEGLEVIVASRKIPCIHIWQSLDVIKKETHGYQHSSAKTEFYVEKPVRRDHHPKSGQPKGPGMRNNNNNKKFKQIINKN
ncbi:RPP25L family protein [Megaselia abdita]